MPGMMDVKNIWHKALGKNTRECSYIFLLSAKKTNSPLQQNSTTRQNHPISDSPLNIALTLYKKLKNRTF
jgi:hypothetical protein